MSKYYTGKPLDKGGTSISTDSPSPPVVKLLSMGEFGSRQSTIIDYGAGNGRNATWLRSMGFEVYAYDPFKGTDYDGWTGVSNILPSTPVDVFLSTYVLNVVNKDVERDIIKFGSTLAPKQIHVVRADLCDVIGKSLCSDKGTILNFYVHDYRGEFPITWSAVQSFAKYGTRTTRGFQRDVWLYDQGFYIPLDHSGYRVFIRD